MKNPDVTVENSLVLIDQHSRRIAMLVDKDPALIETLICRFMEGKKDLYAAVIAPEEELHQLARRVVSFLGAYMRIEDSEILEREVLQCIESCLRSHYL